MRTALARFSASSPPESIHGRAKDLPRSSFQSNVAAVGVSKLRTEVEWDDFDLLGFFAREGFAPAKRLCLEVEVDATKPR